MATASALQSPLQALPSFAFSTGTSGDSSFTSHGSNTCDEPARNVEGADVLMLAMVWQAVPPQYAVSKQRVAEEPQSTLSSTPWPAMQGMMPPETQEEE